VSAVEIRELDPAHIDAALDVRTRSFGYLSSSRVATWREMMAPAVADGRVLAAYDGSRVLGMVRINDLSQWWYGQAVPMAGVAGVVVAPEDRGRGVGTLLMAGVLARSRERGWALSALFPATAPPYRAVGYEQAGAQYVMTVPADALRTLGDEPVKLRRVGADDTPEILAAVRAVHAGSRHCGPIDWGEDITRHWLTVHADELFCYLADDGYLAYRWDSSDTLAVDMAVAASEQTTRALWALVGSGASVAKTVRACIGPQDPIRWLTRDLIVAPDRETEWMLRLVDAPAAVAGRGFPTGVAVQAVLTVEDRQLPANTGTWRLTIADGSGELLRTREDPGALRLGAGGLAGLYAGTPLSTLRLAGLASGGDPQADEPIDAAFATRPFMLDYF
jgi:predicted acetyltransferase